ncbi:hypothetical protein ACMHYB_09425 [Sorangium sp. So ce1128]
MLTKTWFHTGAWIERAKISAQYESEYYTGDAGAVRLEDTPLLEGLSAVEMREACRALKGRPLRQEVYALDGSAGEPHLRNPSIFFAAFRAFLEEFGPATRLLPG